MVTLEGSYRGMLALVTMVGDRLGLLGQGKGSFNNQACIIKVMDKKRLLHGLIVAASVINCLTSPIAPRVVSPGPAKVND